MLPATRRGLTCAYRTATTVPPAVAQGNSSAVTAARALSISPASILPRTLCRTGSGSVENVPRSHRCRLLAASSPAWCAALRRGIHRPTNFTDRSGSTSKMSSRVMTASTRKAVLQHPKQSKHHETRCFVSNHYLRTRTGYDLPLDTLKLKDAKDNIILCFKCNQSAMGRRDMINCDFCNLYWHLDCLDPPLASAPKKSGKGTWKCPNHVDSEVAVPRSASGKVYKIRRPRNPGVIQPALTRGTKNNGIIEIEDEISDEEDQPPGTIYRIPARAIKLDFITKIKQ